MTFELSAFATRVRTFIAAFGSDAVGEGRLTANSQPGTRNSQLQHESHGAGCHDNEFPKLALELFALQFSRNAAYRKFCEARRVTPLTISDWSQIPALPTAAFKELEVTSLAEAERSCVFHSSGTTEQRPSRHFHNAESLAVYEASLWAWFVAQVVGDLRFTIYDLRVVSLTPPPAQAPHSSLVHMFGGLHQKLGADEAAFCGRLAADGAWTLDVDQTLARLQSTESGGSPLLLMGTAFSFVHLLDGMLERQIRLQLPPGSLVMETGGYKGRSRELPKAELHQLITERLGVARPEIVCEYGMSELSSQAYESVSGAGSQVSGEASRITHHASRCFHFPPWARAQIISPETGREVADGETGLIRVFDLANVFSVMAIQTEDLAVRRGRGFELLGRAALAEPRGCSLMAV